MDKEIRAISTVIIKGKEYQVRGLDFDDVEILSLILEKTDFDFTKYEEEAANIIKSSKESADIEKAGVSVFLKIITDLLKKYHKAHNEVAQLVASLIGVELAAVKKMPISTPIMVLKELSKDEDSRDFFSFLRQ